MGGVPFHVELLCDLFRRLFSSPEAVPKLQFLEQLP
jgi:hypothetical protein